MYQKNVQQSYQQFLNQRPLRYSHPYQFPLIISTSSVSQNHIMNLANYRNYIKQEMKFLWTQAQRDQAQMILMQLRIQEANAVFNQQLKQLKNQLKNTTSKYSEITQERDKLEEKNLNNVKLLKEKFQDQQKLREKQLQNKAHNQIIQKQIYELKNENGNGVIQKIYNQIKYKKSKIQQNSQFKQKNQQDIKIFTQKSQFLKKKTENTLGISQQTNSSIKIRENFIETLKNEKEKQQKELLYLKNKIKHSQKSQEQMKAKNQFIRKNLEKQQNLTDILQKQQNDLSHQLDVSLRNLEVQQRGRQKEEERISKALIKMQQGQNDLERLKQYLKQLMESNYTYEQLLKKFHKRDLVLTTALLDRLQSQNNYKNYQQDKLEFSFQNKKQNFKQSPADKRSYNYQNIAPYMTKSPSLIGMNSKINSLYRQNVLNYKQDDKKIKEKERQYQLQLDRKIQQNQALLIKSLSANLLLQKPQITLKTKDIQSQFQRTASSEYQNNLRQQMPKQVSDIINKYKNKQNFTILDQLILPSKSKDKYSTFTKYDSYTNTNKRPQILNQLMNFRPTANKWLQE